MHLDERFHLVGAKELLFLPHGAVKRDAPGHRTAPLLNPLHELEVPAPERQPATAPSEEHIVLRLGQALEHPEVLLRYSVATKGLLVAVHRLKLCWIHEVFTGELINIRHGNNGQQLKEG